VAAIGLAVGGGLYVEAISATVIILIILAGIKPLEKWYQNRNQTHEIRLKVDCGKISLDLLSSALGLSARRISRYISEPSSDPGLDEVHITIKRLSSDDIAEILRKLSSLPDVKEVVKV